MVEAILAGKAHHGMMLEQLERPLPAAWMEQRAFAIVSYAVSSGEPVLLAGSLFPPSPVFAFVHRGQANVELGPSREAGYAIDRKREIDLFTESAR